MTYLEEYVDGLKKLKKYNKKYRKNPPNFNELTIMLDKISRNRSSGTYPEYRALIHKLAVEYVNNHPSGTVVNSCHTISQGFWQSIQSNKLLRETCSLNITIGNVIYKNENIYNLSNSILKKVIRDGMQLDKPLDVHVWLTFIDSTVFDLTIISTLVHRGLLPKSELDNNPVLMWHDSQESEFSFHPFLVDNEFVSRVDKLTMINNI